MLHFVLWKWQQHAFRVTYTAEHVNIVSRQLMQNTLGMATRVICVTDKPEGINPLVTTYPLWADHDGLTNATGKHLPSCYRRLKLFDAKTQRSLGIAVGDWIVSIDLDTIIVRPLTGVLEKIMSSERIFAGWGVRGTYHQLVFNGSFWMFRAHDERLQFMWDTFDPATSPRLCLQRGFLGSDQAWLSMNLAKRDDVYPVRFPEFASYPREVRRLRTLDGRTVVVFFHGSRKPWHPHELRDQPWITKHWR